MFYMRKTEKEKKGLVGFKKRFAKCNFLSLYVTPVDIDVYLYVKSKDTLFSLDVFCILYIDFILVGKLLIYCMFLIIPKL